MKCIYASKLYRASKRKDIIAAALADSGNVELVQQLADSLDEEYRIKDLIDPEDNEAGSGQDDKTSSSKEGGSDGGDLPASLSSGIGGGGGGTGTFDPETDLMDFPEGEDGDIAEGDSGDNSEVSEDEPGVMLEEQPDDGVKEATQIKACTFNVSELNVLKDTLNLLDNIKGVTRIVVKDQELWIYYNDDTNLNNIMTDVIDYLAQAYPSLEFNRLARSDNAIVFEIVMSTLMSEIA